MRSLLSRAVGRGGEEAKKKEDNNESIAAAGALVGGKLAATKHRQTKKKKKKKKSGIAGCMTAQQPESESSPSPETKPRAKPAPFLDSTSQFVGLTFDPFR